MDATFGSRRLCHAFRLQAEYLATQEKDRAQRLILRAGRNTLPHRQVREVIPNRFGIDTWV
jgi:hypothetical protein